ncbi:stationary phase inducible protein CsiE [Pluralibacter gergoviae]|nr:stationary phase inducible protein CsiE [Pluralibacter gergoviae]
MMTVTETPSALSSPQRRCQLLLTLYQPGQDVTAESICRMNNVDAAMAHQDLAETHEELQRTPPAGDRDNRRWPPAD